MTSATDLWRPDQLSLEFKAMCGLFSSKNFFLEASEHVHSDTIRGFDIDSLYTDLLKQMHRQTRDYSIAVEHLQYELRGRQKMIEQNLEAYMGAPPDSVIKRHLEQKAEQLQRSFETKEGELKSLLANPPNQEIERQQLVVVYEGMKKWDGVIDNPFLGREVKRKLALEIVDRIDVDNDG